MTRVALVSSLAALILSTGSPLAGQWKITTESKSQSQGRECNDRSDSRHGHGNRCQRSCCADRSRASRSLPTRDDRSVKPGAGPFRRNEQQRSAGFRQRTHSSSCECSPCRSGRGRRGDGREVVVIASSHHQGGDAVVVLQDGRRRDDDGYGRSPSNDYGAAFGFSRDSSPHRARVDRETGPGSHRLRAHRDADCREPGAILASSGDLYVTVRADGRLSIRSR